MKDRMMAVVAVMAVAAIALVGVGYAAYSGWMTTETGSVTESHLEITWKDSVLMNANDNVKWNSVSTSTGTQYKIADLATTSGVQKTALTSESIQEIANSATTVVVTGEKSATTAFKLNIKYTEALTMGTVATGSKVVTLWYKVSSNGTTWSDDWVAVTDTLKSVNGETGYTLTSGDPTSTATIHIKFGITQASEATYWTTIPTEITGNLMFEAITAA